MQTRTRAVRLLALAAVLAMVVCCLPLQAFAAGEDTRPVTLNIYDIVNGKQVEERTIAVAADATSVNTGSITLPEGYEFTEAGDLAIRDGWVYVEVKPAAPAEKQVGLNIYDIVNGKQVEERTITVAADATSVNTGSITLPAGYEFTEAGDLPIRDGWVYVEVKPAAPAEKQVGLNIYDIVNGKQVEERTITVAADVTSVNTGSIALPAGYEFTEAGDLPIRDGWVYVEVKPVEAAVKSVGLNIYDIVNGKQVEERTITVAADVTSVNTGSIALPEGYEFTEVGDLPIRDGWVYVEVKPVEKKPVDPEQPDGGQSGSGSGTTTANQTSANQKTLPRTGSAGTVAGGALGLSGAIGAAVYAFVIRRRLG